MSVKFFLFFFKFMLYFITGVVDAVGVTVKEIRSGMYVWGRGEYRFITKTIYKGDD